MAVTEFESSAQRRQHAGGHRQGLDRRFSRIRYVLPATPWSPQNVLCESCSRFCGTQHCGAGQPRAGLRAGRGLDSSENGPVNTADIWPLHQIKMVDQRGYQRKTKYFLVKSLFLKVFR